MADQKGEFGATAPQTSVAPLFGAYGSKTEIKNALKIKQNLLFVSISDFVIGVY